MTSTVEKIQRFKTFWSRAEVDRPIIGVRLQTLFPLETFEGAPQAGQVTPDQLHVNDFSADYERLWRAYTHTPGDQIFSASAFYGVPWLEAILGCPVAVQGKSMWAAPCLLDWSDLDEIDFNPANPWYLKLLELTSGVVQQAGNRFPVGLPLLRGPGDIAAAIRGTDRFCLDLIDSSENAKRLLEKCTETYLSVTQALFEILPRWQGGYGGAIRQLWAPGRCVETQVDIGSLISTRHYREFILPHDTIVLSANENAYIHIHASAQHLIDAVLEIQHLPAVEFSIDVGGPRVEEFLPVLKKINSRTALIVQGYLTSEEISLLCSELLHRGLYILILVDNPNEAETLLEKVADQTGYQFPLPATIEHNENS